MMKTDGYYAQATFTSMAANRVSYAFDFRGPSFICDAACSTSFYALAHAFNDLNNGTVDYAVVGASHLCFSPHQTSEFCKMGMLSEEGFSKPFSVNRDGFVRSEAVVSLFLQRHHNSRRTYAGILGVKTNCDGYKTEGITFPSYQCHLRLLQELYRDFEINPDRVTYFEAHATGKYNQLDSN